MHYHLEIIMPPTDNVEAAIEQILEPFNECGTDEDGDPNSYAFWDFYVIGGRFAGEKKRQSFNKESLEAFYEDLKKEKVTVSSLTCGKESLEPSSQIPMVDSLWAKHFPDGGKVCPLFNHYNDQYEHSDGYPDIMTLKDAPPTLTASRIIIAGNNYKDELSAQFMIEDSFYNGVTFVDTKWGGTVKGALEMYVDKIKSYTEEGEERYTPKEEWLLVTVDYHS